MKVKPYILIQYIRTDEYITISQLSEKAGIHVDTVRKQLANLKAQLVNTGYHLDTSNKGIILVKDYGELLPSDLIFFKSFEYFFQTIFIEFIKSGMTNHNLFPSMCKANYYTSRQMVYFFKSRLNMLFKDFKAKSNFEYFNLFVEHAVQSFTCRNISNIFADIMSLEEFNELMFSKGEYLKLSANDYLTLYSILVFDKINSQEINSDYQQIIEYINSGDIEAGLNHFNAVASYAQRSYTTNAMLEYYSSFTGESFEHLSLTDRYQLFPTVAKKLEVIQQQTTDVISYKEFDITIVYEGTEDHLAVIKGTLTGNYPNIVIKTMPSWVFLYGDARISNLAFSNCIINENIRIIPARDADGNYNLDV